MNYDEFEPVSQPESGGYYSTGRPNHVRRHSGLVVVLSTFLVLGCAGAAIASLFDLSVDREPGRTSLVLSDKNPEVSATRVMAASMGDAVGTENSDTDVMQITPPPVRTEGEKTLTEIYEKNIPSIVTIYGGADYSPGYEQSFEALLSDNQVSETGCGVIMSSDGFIITNYAAVSNDQMYWVRLDDTTTYEASVIGCDDATDLAVLKIDAGDLKAGEFGDADKLTVGEQVVCIGNPLGYELGGTMTDGIICAVNKLKDVDGDRTMTILQNNAAPSTGAFGGPLINRYGQIIGINVHAIGGNSSDAVEGLSFAIPISDAKAVVDELVEFGAIPGRPALGLEGQTVPESAKTYYNLPDGVYIDRVTYGGAAEAAGIRAGDIITEFGGNPVFSMDELNLYKNRYSPDDQVIVRIFRAGETFDLTLTLGESR